VKHLFPGSYRNFLKLLCWGVSFTFLASPATIRAASAQNPQQPDSYNSGAPVPTPTPDSSENSKTTPSDRTISQKIKRALAADKTLSPDARRVKIATVGGKVTLQGFVPSPAERNAVVTKATAIAGQGNVTDKIEVPPAKQ
jgi:hyperosmotically inducible periplasmic protein